MLAALLGALSLFATAPASAQVTIWSATLTAANLQNIATGCGSLGTSFAERCSHTTPATYALTDHEFNYESKTFRIIELNTLNIDNSLIFELDTSIPTESVLHVDTSQFAVANAEVRRSGKRAEWTNSGLSWSPGDTVELSLTVPPPMVSLRATPNPVSEPRQVSDPDYRTGDGLVQVTATLSSPLPDNVRIPVKVTPGTAEPGDYEDEAKDHIAITGGSTESIRRIQTKWDADSDDETFTVALDTANPDWPSSVTAGSPDKVEITIRERNAPVNVRLWVSPNPVVEGSPVTVRVLLYKGSRQAVLQYPVTVPVQVYRDTSEEGDHGTIDSITIPAGSSSATKEIWTSRDSDSDDETFLVNLVSRPNELPLGSPSRATVTISESRGGTSPGGGGGGGGFGGGGGGGGGAPPRTAPTDTPTTQPPSTDEPSSPRCGESDTEYLESFYEASGGEHWHDSTNWNSEEPLDQWFGVDTDEDGEVVSLRLADNGLSGDMPTEELLCLNENTELKELALWDNEDLEGEVPEELVFAVERAALREIAEILNINPEWFEDYEDPFNFEDWHEGVMTDDDGRVTELDLPGEIPESIISQFQKLRGIMITTSSGGCALSPEDSSAFSLFLLTLAVFAVLGRKRAR